MLLLQTQQEMSAGTPEAREILANKGVPWDTKHIAAALGFTSPGLNHARATLTKHQMLYCVADGRGNGRRISHVRLSDRGQKEAECFKVHQMSLYAWSRERLRNAVARRQEDVEYWARRDREDRVS
jgi:hypothetical protein